MTMRAILLLAAVLAFGVAPFITPPFQGYDPAIFPVRIERPAIQPVGWAFSIWSVIYVWLIVHAGFGLWQRRDDPVWDRVRVPLIAACLIGAGWLWLAPKAPVAATVVIWVMAGAAITAHLLADGTRDRWLLAAPTAILAGWLTAAAPVSLGVVLAGHGWLGNEAAALAMLALALGLGVSVQRRSGMPVYGLTLVWALIGIAVVNWGELWLVVAAAGLGIVAMALVLLRQGFARPA